MEGVRERVVRLPLYEATKRFTAEVEDTNSKLASKRRGSMEENMLLEKQRERLEVKQIESQFPRKHANEE